MSAIIVFVGNDRSAAVSEVNKNASAKNPDTIYVGSGPGNDSATIQGGINLASAGDTVFVWGGTYYENVVVDKPINLTGEDRETTIIDGGGSGDVVYISVDWVNVSGFGVRNSGKNWDDTGVEFKTSNSNSISNCALYNNSRGICSYNYSSNTTITNCVFYNNDMGMNLWQLNDSQIIDCTFYNHSDDGFYIYSSVNTTVKNCSFINNSVGVVFHLFSNGIITNCVFYNNGCGIVLGSSSRNNTITKCVFYNNPIWVGIHLYYSSNDNSIIGCMFYNNSYAGVYLSSSSDNSITNSTFNNNSIGLLFSPPSNNNQITNCIFYNNSYGISISHWPSYSNNNQIYHNNFINNTNNAHDECINYWDYNGEGNYWSDYTGSDANNDGIGDTVYDIPGGTNKDNHPLMKPVIDGRVQRPPIYIDGNANFTSTNGVTGGSGTVSDPYIIENYDINASTAHGIEIRNTNVYFIIRNCIIHDGKSNYKYGIYLYNVTNGKIENVTSYNNYYYGVYLYSSSNNILVDCNAYDNYEGFSLIFSLNTDIAGCYAYNNSNVGIHLSSFSSNNTITGCAFYNNFKGIWLSSSENNVITNCSIYNNSWGIELWYSSNNNLKNNNLKNREYNFGVWGDVISHYYQDIDTSNTIDGKPIYYVIGQNGLVFDNTMSIGYLGLVSCTNVKIENLTFTNNIRCLVLVNVSFSIIANCAIYNNFDSIILYSSSGNQITNCTVYNSECNGILFYSSSNNQMTDCSVYANSQGIIMKFSSENTITNSSIHDNYDYGIWLDYYSSGTNITNCTVYTNNYGIYFHYCSNYNTITGCDVYGNINYGIHFDYSSNNTVYLCNIYSNGMGIGLYFSSNNNLINACHIYNNYDGMLLFESSNNILTNNILDNAYNFGVYGLDIANYYHKIDPSNKINGKPIYYIVEQNNLTFNETMDIGYLGLVSCNRILIKNLNLTNNIQGLLLANTSHSTLYASDIYNNCEEGIYLFSSSNNTIEACDVYSNYYGIKLYHFSNATHIRGCNIYNNSWGIWTLLSLTGETHNSNIYNNTNYGIYNYNLELQYILNATYNWWSSSTGPYHPTTNPNGDGDNVTDNVLYDPWLNAPVGVINQPPIVNITYPTEGQTVNGTITIDGTANDPEYLGCIVEIKIDAGSWQLAGTFDYMPYAIWFYEWNTTTVPNGLHTIYARAYDGLNYSGIKAVNVYVNNPVIIQIIPEQTTGANITAGYTGSGLLNVSVVAPPALPPELVGIGIYINVTAPTTMSVEWAYIEIPYDPNTLPAGVKEAELRMYYWAGAEWKKCNNTGVDMVNNIVWANVTHLTIFAPMAEKVSEAPVPPTNLFLYIGIAVIVAIIVLACATIGIRRGKKALPPAKTA